VVSDRSKTADQRNAREVLVEKRLGDVEKASRANAMVSGEIKEAINRLNITLTRFETLLEVYIKNCDKTQCLQRQEGP
jgi:hypothetical protein